MNLLTFTHYLPILTTILSAAFCVVLVRAAVTRRSGPHLWWWAVGAFTYGLGTALESTITLHGNTVELTKLWYIAGALLGGYPLAQGVVYLHLKRAKANVLSYLTVAYLAVAAVCVMLSPVVASALERTRPSGAILGWHWVRLMTPFLNLYAFAFLVGGAIYSAARYKKVENGRARFVGNVLIAVGGLLPGMGGSLAKAGMVEALYVLELVGLVFIWSGYAVIAGERARGAEMLRPVV